jgi:hypothetical protein
MIWIIKKADKKLYQMIIINNKTIMWMDKTKCNQTEIKINLNKEEEEMPL